MIGKPATSTDCGEFKRPPPPQAPWCLFLDMDGAFLGIAGVHGFGRRNAQGRYFRPDFVGAGLSYLEGLLSA